MERNLTLMAWCRKEVSLLWWLFLLSAFWNTPHAQADFSAIAADIRNMPNDKKWEYVVSKAEALSIDDPEKGLEMLIWLEKQPFFENRFTSGYLNRKAILLNNSGQQRIAIDIFRNAYEKAQQEKDTLNMAAIMFKLSDCYDQLAIADKAAEAIRSSIANYNVLKDTSMIILAYLKMAVLDKENNPDKSVAQLKQLIPMAQRDSNLIAQIYSTTANIFEAQKQIDSSYYYNQLFLKFNPQGNGPNKFVALYNISQNLRDLTRYKEAHYYITKAFELNQQLKLDIYSIYASLSLAEIEYFMKNTGKAKELLQYIPYEVLNTEQKKQYAELRYKIARDEQDYKSALTYFELFKTNADTLNSAEKTKVVNSIKAKYDLDRKEHEYNVLKEKDGLKKSQLVYQRIGLVFLAIASLVLGFLMYRNFKQKKQIEAYNETISRNLKEKDILLKEIHHRVKNNLQVVSSLLNLQANYITDEAALEAITEGKNRVGSMALIHQNLYTRENLTSINTSVYFEELIEQIEDTYNLDNTGIIFHKEIDSEDLDVDLMIPIGLISNELLSNAHKHAFPNGKKGTISFIFKGEQDDYLLSVKDDGVGMKRDAFLSSKSFGNRMIQTFAEKISATLSVHSEKGGTAFTLRIPRRGRAKVKAS